MHEHNWIKQAIFEGLRTKVKIGGIVFGTMLSAEFDTAILLSSNKAGDERYHIIW